jgi:hypothetical protein
MLIDCGTCAVRGAGCADCVVTVLLGENDGLTQHLDAVEVGLEARNAMSVLAQVGLVPHLRHTPAVRRVS